MIDCIEEPHKPQKAEVKNINYVWHAFLPNGVLKSAGIGEIVDMVEEAWPRIPKGWQLQWEAKPTKFVVREVESKNTKLSKSKLNSGV